MNVTLDNTQRTTLRSVAVMALENRPLPDHWLEDGSLYHNLASAIQQLDHPDTDASLLDRLHTAEARCAILESKWASVPWDALWRVFNQAAGGETWATLWNWLSANQPQEFNEWPTTEEAKP